MLKNILSVCRIQNNLCGSGIARTFDKMATINFPTVYCEKCLILKPRTQFFHSTSLKLGVEDRRSLSATMPKRDEGSDGEKSIDVDSHIHSKDDLFPDYDLPNKLFDGVPFKDIPVVNIKATKNNTLLTFFDNDIVKEVRSCGIEGFKNARKGTNIAAQATAITFSSKLIRKGFKNVRVKVGGLGPGRMASIKGLQMGGLNIISVTDNTKVSWNPPRPRKQRRI